jgi:hypothetical protein
VRVCEAGGVAVPVGEGGDVVGFAGHGRLGFGNEVSAKSRNRIHAARTTAQWKALRAVV